MSDLTASRRRLADALQDTVRLEAEERVRRAYEHGFAAGRRQAEVLADKATYRRGYLAGYQARKSDRPCEPDGSRMGAPRKALAPTGRSYGVAA